MVTVPEPRRWRPTPLLRASFALHAAALALVVLSPRRWRAALAAAALDHALVATAAMLPRCAWLGPTLVRLPGGAPAVGLTFDDGPDPEVTPRVLDLLAERGARATFFLIGRRAVRHPHLVRRIVAEGHRVENHTFRHSSAFALYGPRRLGLELDRAQAALADLAGRPPLYLRAPAGIRSPYLEPLLAARGLHLAAWTRRGFDTRDADAARVARRLLTGLAAGDVLLLHDGNAARTAAGTPVVLEALPRLLDALAAARLEPVPLPDPPTPRGAAGG